MTRDKRQFGTQRSVRRNAMILQLVAQHLQYAQCQLIQANWQMALGGLSKQSANIVKYLAGKKAAFDNVFQG